MRDALDKMFAMDHAARATPKFRVTSSRTAEFVIELPRTASTSVIRLGENIARGQVVAAYRIDGAGDDGVWKQISQGTTIGHAKLDRVGRLSLRRLRVTIDDAVAEPESITLSVFS